MARMAKRGRSKFKKSLTVIVSILIIVFVLVCYFNPNVYNKLLEFIKGPTDDNYIKNISKDLVEVNTLVDAKVHFIDVGQGDSILITLPDYKNVLIDAGDNRTANNKHMVEYINENAHKTKDKVVIDHFILTHADADHIGGADKIFENFEVKKVYRPYVLYNGSNEEFSNEFNQGSISQASATYEDFLTGLLSETYGENNYKCEWEFFNYDSDFGCNIKYQEETYTYSFDFLTPVSSVEDIKYKDPNDYSPIIKFDYEDTTVLFTGDAETEAEADFIEAYSVKDANYLDVDVLKVSHHGSSTSTTQSMLDLVLPEYAVISCGEGNSYKHPHAPVLARLMELSCILYRTDNNGDIVLNINNLGEFEFNVDFLSINNYEAPN